jgi:hypothetical protein
MNSTEELKQIGHWEVQSKTIFKSKLPQSSMIDPTQPSQNLKSQKDYSKQTLLINPINLVMLNVNSYAGGIQNMWNKANPSTHKASIQQSKFEN